MGSARCRAPTLARKVCRWGRDRRAAAKTARRPRALSSSALSQTGAPGKPGPHVVVVVVPVVVGRRRSSSLSRSLSLSPAAPARRRCEFAQTPRAPVALDTPYGSRKARAPPSVTSIRSAARPGLDRSISYEIAAPQQHRGVFGALRAERVRRDDLPLSPQSGLPRVPSRLVVRCLVSMQLLSADRGSGPRARPCAVSARRHPPPASARAHPSSTNTAPWRRARRARATLRP